MDVDKVEFLASYVGKRGFISRDLGEAIADLLEEINDPSVDSLSRIADFCIERGLTR